MNMFSKKPTEDEKEEKQPQEQPPREYKAKSINKKWLKIAFAIGVTVIIYNIFKAPQPKVKEDVKQETTQTQTKENPFSTNYSDVRDVVPQVSEHRNNGVQGTTNNTENINYEEQLKAEKIKQLEEEAEQAKKSAISFQFYEVKEQNNQGQQVQQPLVDYDQNRQGSKKNFLLNEKSTEIYSNSITISPLSPYELKAGDFIPAIVETAMNSDVYGKVVVAKVTQNIYDTVTGNYLLIPQGTVVTGVYDSNITWGQERLLVVWQRLRLPNGDSITLDNLQGVDMIGQAGLPGKVNNHFATLLKGVLLSSAMGATAAIVTDDDDDWRSEAGEGAGLSIIQIGDKFTTKALDRQPTIEIKAGERFNIMIHSDIILKPYKLKR